MRPPEATANGHSRPVDVDRLRGGVDQPDRPGGQQDMLAEDPHPGVDDEVRGADVLGVLADLSDAAVGGLEA
ncbi:hypothetical protein BN2537_17171 [Streptomyces venezuelae]|nr:hypothetical protein BN2537_17171 [Streptomyces venezuelae]